MLLVACLHAATGAIRFRMPARADAFVGMAVADAAVAQESLRHPAARTESVTALLLCWSRLPRHTLCTAAAPHPSLQSSVGLQLQQITTIGTDKALLADVTAKSPDASYIELLRLFKVRRSVADGHSQRGMLHCACFALPASICSHLPRPTLCSVLRCLFVCLLACLFVCLLATGLCKTRRRWRGRRCTCVIARLMAYSRLAAQGCVRALVRCRQPRRAAAAQAHCTSAYA